jgi:hypothetical protein
MARATPAHWRPRNALDAAELEKEQREERNGGQQQGRGECRRAVEAEDEAELIDREPEDTTEQEPAAVGARERGKPTLDRQDGHRDERHGEEACGRERERPPLGERQLGEPVAETPVHHRHNSEQIGTQRAPRSRKRHAPEYSGSPGVFTPVLAANSGSGSARLTGEVSSSSADMV